ncbi:protealysin propeptide domain-containing protein [Xenorhabdus lircayensis]|uniref:Protealysin N-terminal propeptide domain-containing protein n=1 Tax=Xenorhabdus lircayensis TaxID=2763499 RepID=A0ABS0U0R1_9GAMM|nr:protealysin propeptide domain-containing protein [Xenorhabdus lircayensis]MBI6547472.1 hypothetical protein [Xenorhabdus lircayensis]
MSDNRASKQNIIPPHLLECIAKNCDESDKKYILKTLDHVNKLMKKSVKKDALDSEDKSMNYDNKKLTEPENS